ncbi:hypothetical protein D3C87_1031720 [compost metagenome]
MPHRFIFSLRFSSKVFLRILAVSIAMLVFMSLFRLNLYFLSVFHAAPDADFTEVMHSFLAGLRFDTLIMGFALIPVVLFTTIQAFMESWPKRMFTFYRFYLGFAWTVICLMTFIDFYHFTNVGKRMRFADYLTWNFDTLLGQAQNILPNQSVIFAVITLLLLALGLMLVVALRFGEWKDEFSPRKGNKFEIFIRLIFPFVLIVLAARGTVEAHHLGMEHSVVSSVSSINEMALNPLWCFDK